ncbi:MAG: sigma-70 family RNA polymerase sigma factor [Dysgonamonadaceae bacterium]|nr:sigma-70 family RNA polymerase sigma factor [Dysgonamonadaceae bacterium]
MFLSDSISNITDEKLLEEYKKTGNTEYFGQLYHRYIPLIYGLCLKYLGDKEKSEDAVMQLFEDLLDKVVKYDIRIFRTWLHSVAKNHCLQILRQPEKEILLDFNTALMESDSILNLLDEGEENEKWNVLQECMKRLPEVQQICISRFFLKQMSYVDIVDITGYQLKSVKSYIQNGKRNLKICMEKKLAE